MRVKNFFSKTEINKILKENLIILVDTREKEKKHILDFFDSKGYQYENKKNDEGDYSIKIKAIPDMGLYKDIYIPVMIEKKNSVNELVQSIKQRTRFENEFLRASFKNEKIILLVEEAEGYQNIITGKYNSDYKPKAFLGSLKSFEARYKFDTVFLDKKYSGNFIYWTLYYAAREYLKY